MRALEVLQNWMIYRMPCPPQEWVSASGHTFQLRGSRFKQILYVLFKSFHSKQLSRRFYRTLKLTRSNLRDIPVQSIRSALNSSTYFSSISAIWPVRGECIPHIHNGKYARRQRNFFAFQAARIASTIPFFMMAIRNIKRGAQVFN
jgi:hypothetical protein